MSDDQELSGKSIMLTMILAASLRGVSAVKASGPDEFEVDGPALLDALLALAAEEVVELRPSEALDDRRHESYSARCWGSDKTSNASRTLM